MKPKIIDAIIIFNELDLLEIRLNELDAVVDQFVIVEADHTFKGKPKPLYYVENAHRFSSFQEKISHYIVQFPPDVLKMGRDEAETQQTHWQRQTFQRDAINHVLRGMNLHQKDIILVSDCDEIPKLEKVQTLYKWFRFRKFAIFVQRGCYFYFNNITDPYDKWCGTVACQYKTFQKIGAENLRFANRRAGRRLEKYGLKTALKNFPYLIRGAGWHFSYFGGETQVQYKLDSISGSYSTDDIEKRTAHHQFSLITEKNWEIPDFLPDYVKQHKEKFKKYFKFLQT